MKNESLLILQYRYSLWLPIDLQRSWEKGPLAGLASRLLTKLLKWSKQFIGCRILRIVGLITIYTTAAAASTALQISIQIHNIIQNWTKDAHTTWTTQAQINEKVLDEIQEIKIAIQWVWDQLIDFEKQALLKCDWNSTQFCVTSVHFSNNAYN